MTVERGIDPRGVRADAVRRRRPAARGRAGAASSGSSASCARARRACCARSAWPPRRHGATSSRTVMLARRGRSSRERARAGERDALHRRGRRRALASTPARVRVRHELRYGGQSFELPVDEELEPAASAARARPARTLREAFAQAHEQRYGYRDDAAEVELVNVRVSVVGPGARAAPGARARRREPRRRAHASCSTASGSRRRCRAASCAPGTRVRARRCARCPRRRCSCRPAGSGDVDAHGTVHLRRRDGGMSGLDPIELQVITGALRAACEEMGAVLIRSAHSSNIKERRDASTALFDPRRRDGDAGRAHPRASRLDARRGGAVLGEEHAPGVSWVLNDPFAGGTHLPDITVVTPVLRAHGAAARVRRQPRPPRRRRRARARARCPPTAARSRRRAS